MRHEPSSRCRFHIALRSGCRPSVGYPKALECVGPPVEHHVQIRGGHGVRGDQLELLAVGPSVPRMGSASGSLSARRCVRNGRAPKRGTAAQHLVQDAAEGPGICPLLHGSWAGVILGNEAAQSPTMTAVGTAAAKLSQIPVPVPQNSSSLIPIRIRSDPECLIAAGAQRWADSRALPSASLTPSSVAHSRLAYTSAHGSEAAYGHFSVGDACLGFTS